MATRGVAMFQLGIGNTGSNSANNLVIRYPLPPGASFSGVSGNDWVAWQDGGTVLCLRGGLAAGAQTTVTLNVVMPAAADRIENRFELSSDESATVTATQQTDILLSYPVWAEGLGNQDPLADDDGNQLSNALEYGFGGDPASGRLLSPMGDPLLPVATFSAAEGGKLQVIYRRRRAAGMLGIEYRLEAATSLAPAVWAACDAGPSSPLHCSETVESLDDSEFGMERVTATIQSTGHQRLFARVSVKVTAPPE